MTDFEIGAASIAAGEMQVLELPLAHLTSGSRIGLPLMVINGASPGPAMWLTAAIHGDEIAGVEIVRRVVKAIDPEQLHGTVVAAPVVNVYGFNTGDRYLPDRRDLNRAFPGSRRGSLAGQVAHLVMSEIVERCTVGIDLHTGSDHRSNLPQIRANLDDAHARQLAEGFGAPVVLHAQTRDGSLRQAATERGSTVLLYEGGEASRLDEATVAAGADGVLRVMGRLEMIAASPAASEPIVWSRRSRWVRASRSGITHCEASLGQHVGKGDRLGIIRNTFGDRLSTLKAPFDGVVIGANQHPLVNRGDAILHVAALTSP